MEVSKIRPNVGSHEPLDAATKIIVLMRPDWQVAMVWRQTRPRLPHEHRLVSVLPQVPQRSEVSILWERIATPVTSVEDMVNKTTWNTLAGRGPGDTKSKPR